MLKKNILDLLSKSAQTLDNEQVPGTKMTVTHLVYGDRLTYLIGLSGILNPLLSMEDEFKRGITFTVEGKVVNTSNLWKSAESALPKLLQHPNAQVLTRDELIAAFLYTTPAYKVVNDFLREIFPSKNPHLLLTKEKTWASTVIHINSAIRKLSQLCTSNYPTTWRGVAIPLAPDFFIPDKRGMICATEYAFMSTSENKDKAFDFAKQGKFPTIFCVKCRAEDPGGFHMGASLEWCSDVPSEKEVLFPPLTLFEVLKRERKNNVTTITVAPTYI